MENLGCLSLNNPVVYTDYLSRKIRNTKYQAPSTKRQPPTSKYQRTTKFMNKRNYNVFFHLHTVSGIVISVVLYIIFFAGSFAFFKDDITNWQRNESVKAEKEIQLDFDSAIDSLKANFNLYGRDITIKQPTDERRVNIRLTASKDSLATDEGKQSQFLYLDTETYKTYDYVSSYSLGEFLYRLHFLAQVPYPLGYYLAGFVALFFLFAIITGVLIHWEKIIPNFYTFRPLAKLKTLWTDAHTALGMIGLPFQFVYAVTGAFFMIKLLLVAPSVAILYNGDKTKLFSDLEYDNYITHSLEYNKSDKETSIDYYINNVHTIWDNFNITDVNIYNYGDSNMQVSIEGVSNLKDKFASVGKITYKVTTNEIISQKNPITETSYIGSVKNILYRLHYGDYGDYGLKIISFLLGIISCFVIISGIMIWLVARDKKNIPEKKRRFNMRVVRVYLAICLSMYPITALSFIAVKLFSVGGQSFIYSVYFIGWLLLTVFFILKKDIYFTNKYTMLLGSIFGFLVPITNGIITGNWFWNSFQNQQTSIFIIDVFWIVVPIITFLIYLKLKQKKAS